MKIMKSVKGPLVKGSACLADKSNLCGLGSTRRLFSAHGAMNWVTMHPCPSVVCRNRKTGATYAVKATTLNITPSNARAHTRSQALVTVSQSACYANNRVTPRGTSAVHAEETLRHRTSRMLLRLRPGLPLRIQLRQMRSPIRAERTLFRGGKERQR
jgi:hypothetical protein